MVQFIAREYAFLDKKPADDLDFTKERHKERSRDLYIRQIRFETILHLVEFGSRSNAFLDEKFAHGPELM